MMHPESSMSEEKPLVRSLALLFVFAAVLYKHVMWRVYLYIYI